MERAAAPHLENRAAVRVFESRQRGIRALTLGHPEGLCRVRDAPRNLCFAQIAQTVLLVIHDEHRSAIDVASTKINAVRGGSVGPSSAGGHPSRARAPGCQCCSLRFSAD